MKKGLDCGNSQVCQTFYLPNCIIILLIIYIWSKFIMTCVIIKLYQTSNINYFSSFCCWSLPLNSFIYLLSLIRFGNFNLKIILSAESFILFYMSEFEFCNFFSKSVFGTTLNPRFSIFTIVLILNTFPKYPKCLF